MSVSWARPAKGSWSTPRNPRGLDDPRGGAAAVAANLAALDARRKQLFANVGGTTTKSKWRAAGDSFEAFCGRVGVEPLVDNALPHNLVFAWLDDKCDDAENAASVKHWISQLYSHYVHDNESPPYSKTDDGPFYARAKAALGVEYGVSTKRPPGVNAAMLRRVHDTLQPESDPKLRAFWVHVVAAYHWLLRPNEHLGPNCILRVKDVRIFREAAASTRVAQLSIFASKGLRRTHAASSEFEVTYTRETDGPLDLIPMLERYIHDFDLAKTPDAPLFPDLNTNGSLRSGYMSMDSFNVQLRSLLARAGLSTAPSARGLRSGRRTDLRNSGTPSDVVRQLGRWKSEPMSYRYHRTDPRCAARIPRNNA